MKNKGGVSVYYKKHISLFRRDNRCTLSSCLVPEICLENQNCFVMYHINNELPIYSVISGDFNARCTKSCNKNITNSIDRKIDTLTSSAGYNQIINKPTHIVNN